jgi:hypothetical protein
MKIKKWETYEYHDPRKVLIKLGYVQNLVAVSDLPDKTKNLRNKNQEKYLEGRQAALFCYGIGEAFLKTQVYFALVEDSDYDCVALRNEKGNPVYTPIQLKELVPESLNSSMSLEEELQKLKKYVTSDDLVIALHVNRAGKLEFPKIHVPELNVAEVWLFGSKSAGQSRWFLYGDLLNNPHFFEFSYPTS